MQQITARVNLVAPGPNVHPTVARVYHEIETELGFGIVPNVFRAMAGHPDFLAANWSLFRSVVLRGRLPRALKEMIGIVVSCVHGSTYARDVHLHSLAVQGIEKGLLAVLGAGARPTEGLPASQLAVLELAHAAATAPHGIAESALRNARECGVDQDELLEVFAAIQLFTAVNTFTDNAAVPVDAL